MIESKKLVYLAGPYTKPDPCENVNRTCSLATELIDLGFAPLIPHLTMLWHVITPRPIEFWYDYDLQLVLRCDALLRIPGESTGADREVEFARQRGIPVVGSVADLVAWRRAQLLFPISEASP